MVFIASSDMESRVTQVKKRSDLSHIVVINDLFGTILLGFMPLGSAIWSPVYYQSTVINFQMFSYNFVLKLVMAGSVVNISHVHCK